MSDHDRALLLAAALLLTALLGAGCAHCPPCPPPPPPEVVTVAIAVPVVPPALEIHAAPSRPATLTDASAALADPVGWIKVAAAYIESMARSDLANRQELAASNQARAEAEAEAERIRADLKRRGITLKEP